MSDTDSIIKSEWTDLVGDVVYHQQNGLRMGLRLRIAGERANLGRCVGECNGRLAFVEKGITDLVWNEDRQKVWDDLEHMFRLYCKNGWFGAVPNGGKS